MKIWVTVLALLSCSVLSVLAAMPGDKYIAGTIGVGVLDSGEVQDAYMCSHLNYAIQLDDSISSAYGESLFESLIKSGKCKKVKAGTELEIVEVYMGDEYYHVRLMGQTQMLWVNRMFVRPVENEQNKVSRKDEVSEGNVK